MKKLIKDFFCTRLLLLLCIAGFTSALAAQKPTSGVIYRFVNVSTGKAMSNGNIAEHNAYLVLADIDESHLGQEWMVLGTGTGGNFTIFNTNYRQAVDMALDSKTPGKLLQWEMKANSNQIFAIEAVEGTENTYLLLNASNRSQVVTAEPDGSLKLGNDLTAAAAQFRLESLSKTVEINYPLAGQNYVIKSVSSEKVLSNANIGTTNAPIITENYKEGDVGQIWQANAIGNSTTTFQLENTYYGMAIDLALNSDKNPLQWHPDMENDNQKIIFTEVSDLEGYYTLSGSSGGNTKYLQVNSSGDVVKTASGGSYSNYFTLQLVPAPEPAPQPDWENEAVYERNKEKGHAAYIPYSNTAALKADARFNAPWLNPEGANYLSLNGVWNLQYHSSPDQRPGEAFYGDLVDASSWDTISVPSCLEMKGYGDPLYLNEAYAFNDTPPYIRMLNGLSNSVASYRRDFNLPENWKDEQRIFLHFDGIYSAAYVWINGQMVGYTEGANNDAEFDITNFVREGKNNISVQVFRWSDGSYLEGQDMWHMSGIHRDVYLFATPKTFIRDHYITANLSAADNYESGSMNVELNWDNRDSLVSQQKVRITLLAPDGSEVASEEKDINFTKDDAAKTDNISFASLSNLQPWTAETPNLYTVIVSQVDAEGREQSVFATKYGFRHVEIKNNLVYVNGKQIYFKGVNTQDTHPVHGRSIDVPTMIKDVVLMKQANINTLRMSHYPHQTKFYHLLDFYGIYCMDEADVECHKNWSDGGNISSSLSWRPQFVDRNERCVLRDRNFPSVLFWSLGNESGGGNNFDAAYDAVRKLDPRPIHYEGATRAGTSPTDFYTVMYPSVDRTRNLANNAGQPFFICEYAHAMGNGVGNLQEYWDLIEGSPYGIGACIWDWVDQSIYDADDIKTGNLVKNGRHNYKSGYDYGGPNQGNFVNNGLIQAWRAWSPKLTEVKQVYQYVKFTEFTNKKLSLHNAYGFLNLDNFKLKYSVLVDGDVVEEGEMEIPSTAAGEDCTLTLPYTTEAEEGREVLINFEVCLKEATSWANTDYAVAAKQFVIQQRPNQLSTVQIADKAKLNVSEVGSELTVKNENVELTFTSEGLTSWKYRELNVLHSSGMPEYSNFRWIENDQYDDKTNGVGSKTRNITVAEDNTSVTVQYTAEGSKCPYVFIYTVYSDGTIDLKAEYSPAVGDLRRIGMEMAFNRKLEDVSYYARGPWENYCDRKSGSFLGKYTTTVSDMFVEYPHPQTMGGREELRKLTLTDPETGKGINVETQGQVAFSLLHYDDKNFDSYRLHPWDLSAEGEATYAHFDYRQRGVGNGSCGQGTGTLNKYFCPSAGKQIYTLRFTPVDKSVSGVTLTPTAPANYDIAYERSLGALVCEGTLLAGTDIAVYDMGGVLVARQLLATPAQRAAIDLKTQSAGSYIVIVKNADGQRKHKFLK